MNWIPNHLVIRADANSHIGTGHVMRCIALGQLWQSHGGIVTFLTCCENHHLSERLADEGFDQRLIKKPYPNCVDLHQTLEVLAECSYDNKTSKSWLVLDGYHFAPDYQKAIRNANHEVLVVDDMNHQPCYHADILLNQNINAVELKYCCDTDTLLLLGTQYTLLRQEFLSTCMYQRPIRKRAINILVTLGGADPENATLKVIETIKLNDDPKLIVKIVCGPANSHRPSLEKAIRSAPCSMEILCSPHYMPELICWADLAISAAGSTCWELAFMGIPTMVLIVADNQEEIAVGLDKAGAMLNLGWVHTISIYDMAKSLAVTLASAQKRRQLRQRACALIDGKGSLRVMETMTTRLVPSISP